MKQKRSPFEEAIKLLDFAPSDEKLDSLIEIVMTTDYDSEFSLEREQRILHGLSKITHQTLGAILKQALHKAQLSVSQLITEVTIPEQVFNNLLADSIVITNVPVNLFKKVIVRLNVPLNEIRTASRYTSRILSRSSTPADSFILGRKSTFNSLDLDVERQTGQELFESEEAIELYLERLEELLND